MAAHGKPEIVNTDQGCQFTSAEFTQPLLAAGVKLSTDGKGRCLDNVFVERLWRSLKYEEVYLKRYESVAHAPARSASMVRDPLTGALGIASAKTVSLDGDVSILIEQSGLKPDGSPKPPLYASAERVVVEERRTLQVSKDSAATSGGPLARTPLLY